MKKIIILTAIVFSFSITKAQINKGSFLIGGQANSSNDKRNDSLSSSNNPTTNVSISIGRAFKDNSVYGISLGYAPFSTTNTALNNGSSSFKAKVYNAGIFYRKYDKLVNKLYLFNEFGGRFSYMHSSATYETNASVNFTSGTTDAYFGSLYFTPEVAYRICKKIDLELLLPNIVSLSYLTSKSVNNSLIQPITTKHDSCAFNTNLGLNALGFGIKIIE